MYCWRPQIGSQYEELYDIIKNGFKDTQVYKVNLLWILICSDYYLKYYFIRKLVLKLVYHLAIV
jgi:hypothetical protein